MRCALPLAIALSAHAAAADTITVGPTDDVEAAINALAPGDELIVADGTYTLSGRFGVTVLGTEAMPILIRAADGATPIFDRPVADQNIWDVDDAAYVTIRGLTFARGSAGLRLSGARYVTIEDCEIRDTGDVALRANDGGVIYDHLHVVHNQIHHTNGTGEGMYLGCNSNGCQVKDSVIERNWVHHTNQSTVEQGDGIELKEGSSGNVIRDNVVHDTNYPCILTYSTVGNGPANVIERNALWHCGDHGIQSAADAIIRNNVILGSGSNGIAMQPHQAGSPSNLVVAHNTVLHPTNTAISVSGAIGSVVIANNAVYAQSGSAITVGGDLSMVTVAGNVGVGGGVTGGLATGDLAADFAGASYAGAPPMDLFPSGTGALVGGGDATYAVADDFNGTPRDGTVDVGAYRWAAGGNPGWPLGEGFKDPTPTGGGDGGVGSPDGGGAGDDGGGDGGGYVNTSGDDGCGCRVGGRPGGTIAAVAWLMLTTRLRRRQRRRPRD